MNGIQISIPGWDFLDPDRLQKEHQKRGKIPLFFSVSKKLAFGDLFRHTYGVLMKPVHILCEAPAGMFSCKHENSPPDRVLRTANVPVRLLTAGQPVDTNKSQRGCDPSDNTPWGLSTV